MTLFVTGDVHGDAYFDKMSDPELLGLTKSDYVLVCGDLEVVRADPEERAFCIKRLEEMPYSTLFIDGNHEELDLIASYPEETWRGGRVRRISESIRYLERGQVFEIDGMSVLAMGGAKTFAHAREAGLLTGPDAGIPNGLQRAETMANLARHGNRVDVIASHTAPSGVLPLLPQRESVPVSEFTDWLQEIADSSAFGQWLFGHYHCDVSPRPGFRCLLNVLYRADDGALFRDPVVEPQKGRRKGRVALPATRDDGSQL